MWLLFIFESSKKRRGHFAWFNHGIIASLKNTIQLDYDLLKCNVKIFALHEDIEALGLKKIIATKIKIIDYSIK